MRNLPPPFHLFRARQLFSAVRKSLSNGPSLLRQSPAPFQNLQSLCRYFIGIVVRHKLNSEPLRLFLGGFSMILSLFQPPLSAITTTPMSLYTCLGTCNALLPTCSFLAKYLICQKLNLRGSLQALSKTSSATLRNGCLDFENCRFGQYWFRKQESGSRCLLKAKAGSAAKLGLIQDGPATAPE